MHGPLANKFVILDNKYKILADLELELMDIRNKGNIMNMKEQDRLQTLKSFCKKQRNP